MRTIKTYLLVICTAFLLGACDGFLDTVPPTGVSINAYYNDEEEARTALNAVYDNLSAQLDRLYGLGIDAVGIYCGDLARVGRTSDRWNPYERNTQDGSEFVVEVIWRECFAGIYRANLFLQKIAGIEMDTVLKNRFTAEARFLRGYFYFELIKIFGDVPLLTEPVNPTEANVPRDPKAAIVAQIISDFEAAISFLPLKSEYGASEIGRATKGTAQAFLTKLYIYENQWQNAVDVGTEVISSAEYTLHANFLDNFSVAHENGVESIFEVQCKSGTDTGEGNAHNDLEGFEGTPNPRGFTTPRSEYVDSFGSRPDGLDDPRKDFTTAFNIISPTFYRSVKYIEGFSNGKQFDSDLNYKLMRYADFLLLYAEALNEVARTDEALDLINQVREREDVGMAPLLGLDQVQTRLAIRDERKWELGLEGHRFFDLVRWGIVGEIIRGQNRTFIDGVHELMPIPISELDLNPEFTQNPGY